MYSTGRLPKFHLYPDSKKLYPEYKESKGFQRILRAVNSPKVQIPINIRAFVKDLSLSELNTLQKAAQDIARRIRRVIKNKIREDQLPTFDPLRIKFIDVFNALSRPVPGVGIGHMLFMLAASPFLSVFIYLFMVIALVVLKLIVTGSVELLSKFNCSANLYKNAVSFLAMPERIQAEINDFTNQIKNRFKFKIQEYATAGDALYLLESHFIPLVD